MSTVYNVNKGINKPLEFKGLKAQYILYLGAGLVALLLVFAVLYMTGVSPYLCIAIVCGCGGVLITRMYALSHKYGEYGLMKKLAEKQLPDAVCGRSRKCFRALRHHK
ncbi:DUF4133 domain-containing protein [Chitinophaga sp. XS-30]|uniref:DUF4133 domain-containing protein n=1 Tax=Chitinophaga sp. XS-30 TaxID=2604421 RepID=UPI0011DD10A6|nr:DUF4133 domain-containing protein [Chitinophaga sp. XS-30]QEH39438.1 DUF4133 domain-containing protein [Chitinophaga sp. XS-30]